MTDDIISELLDLSIKTKDKHSLIAPLFDELKESFKEKDFNYGFFILNYLKKLDPDNKELDLLFEKYFDRAASYYAKLYIPREENTFFKDSWVDLKNIPKEVSIDVKGSWVSALGFSKADKSQISIIKTILALKDIFKIKTSKTKCDRKDIEKIIKKYKIPKNISIKIFTFFLPSSS